IYLISNKKSPNPREHVLTYERRWAIEAYFRTAKQNLGIGDCQSKKESVQTAHIYCVMLAYTFLQEQKDFKKKKPVEAVLNNIRYYKPPPHYDHSINTFMQL